MKKVKCSVCKARLEPVAEDYEEFEHETGILWKICEECQKKSKVD